MTCDMQRHVTDRRSNLSISFVKVNTAYVGLKVRAALRGTGIVGNMYCSMGSHGNAYQWVNCDVCLF